MSVRWLVAVAAAGLVFAPAAHADAADGKFLGAISAAGLPGDPGQWLADGHATCANFGSPMMTGEMLGLEARGLSNVQAEAVMEDGIRAFCPEKGPWGPL